jgi:hypothetical protein
VAHGRARFQTPLEDDFELPGSDIIRNHYPETERTNKRSIPVRIMYKNAIYSHKACAAQSVHWDMPPADEEAIKKLLGSVLIALWTTSVFVYAGSHLWSRCQSRLRRPIEIVMPSGSILFFTTIAHAGYGVWSLAEAVFRPCPSFDNLMPIRIRDLLIRLQAHIGRPSSPTPSFVYKSINPTRTARLFHYPKPASYLYLDHDVQPEVYYPPVFAPEGREGTIALEYGARSEFPKDAPEGSEEVKDETRAMSDESSGDEVDAAARPVVSSSIDKRKQTQLADNRAKRQRAQVNLETLSWSLEIDNRRYTNIRDAQCEVESKSYVRKQCDIDQLLDECDHVRQWALWAEEVIPRAQGWRDRLTRALDAVTTNDITVSKFAEDLTTSTSWRWINVKVPSMEAWSIILSLETFLALNLDQLLSLRCEEGQKMSIILLVRHGTEYANVLIVRESVKTMMTTTRMLQIEIFKQWLNAKVMDPSLQDDEFKTHVMMAWME